MKVSCNISGPLTKEYRDIITKIIENVIIKKYKLLKYKEIDKITINIKEN